MAVTRGNGDSMATGGGATASVGLFETSQRLIFARAPINQVVSQVRFPTILKIDQIPTDFQERIRNTFPLYERNAGLPQPEGIQLPQQIMQLLQGQIAGGHQFMTMDRQNVVTLAQDALTLTTTKYTRWEDFFSHFRAPLRALVEIYAPMLYTRVALRYVNWIRKDQLGLASDYAWAKLLRSEILGELSLAEFEPHIQRTLTQTRINLPELSGTLHFQHGFNVFATGELPAYVLDFDISNQTQTEIANAEPILDRYHQLAGHAFRWCITPELRDILGPKPAE